jgi:four helix bundle protein
VKSTPTRGVKQSLKPDAYKQSEGVRLQMTGGATFESLDVYRRAYALALTVHRESLRFPEVERFVLADQMRRASKSICGNLAEGYSRQRGSGADWKRFLIMAAGSADEMQVWASFARDLGYLEAATASDWQQSYAEIARMIAGLMKAWDAR